jgi:hypothetical protein
MIKIEVTGNSIAEVSDKLLAIGASLQRTVSHDADNAAREALQAKRDAAKKEVAEAAPEVAEEAPAPLPSSGQTEAPPITKEKVSASSPTEASDAPSDTLNFDTDVAPYVLQVVKEKGKPVAQEILSQFGVEKASLMGPALWPELVALLKAAL